MSVSKEKFVRDMLAAQDARRFDAKEAEAIGYIEGYDGYDYKTAFRKRSGDELSVYESYMHNKRYLKGRKCTKFQYQC